MRTVDNEFGSAVVQGFRASQTPVADDPYVYLRVFEIGTQGDYSHDGSIRLAPEEADELGEYLRQEAEFARNVRDGEEDK